MNNQHLTALARCYMRAACDKLMQPQRFCVLRLVRVRGKWCFHREAS